MTSRTSSTLVRRRYRSLRRAVVSAPSKRRGVLQRASSLPSKGAPLSHMRQKRDLKGPFVASPGKEEGTNSRPLLHTHTCTARNVDAAATSSSSHLARVPSPPSFFPAVASATSACSDGGRRRRPRSAAAAAAVIQSGEARGGGNTPSRREGLSIRPFPPACQ